MDFGKDAVYDAWNVLKNGYCKILVVNLTNDTYKPVLVTDHEWQCHPPHNLSSFFQWFIDNDFIHPDDKEKFLAFWSNHDGYVEYRRRQLDNSWEWVVMDVLPTNNYKEDNKECILCVSYLMY